MSSNNNSSSSVLSKCAACGKGGDNLKVCISCKQVKYCNRDCQKLHWQKHKKECRQLAVERHNQETVFSNIDVDAISKKFSNIEISDEDLFADPPPKEDCDICFLPIPHSHAGGGCGVNTVYQPCCGKRLCRGCMIAAQDEMEKGKMKECCPFCRMPLPTSTEESLERCILRMKLGDADAFSKVGRHYCDGEMGLPKDSKKALELCYRAAELGSCEAHLDLAIAYGEGEMKDDDAPYYLGEGVDKDTKKSLQHYKIAAIGGHEMARHNMGVAEEDFGNYDRAIKHYIIAARCGFEDSLKAVGGGYKHGLITKDEYASILRAHKDSRDEMKSKQRQKAAIT